MDFIAPFRQHQLKQSELHDAKKILQPVRIFLIIRFRSKPFVVLVPLMPLRPSSLYRVVTKCAHFARRLITQVYVTRQYLTRGTHLQPHIVRVYLSFVESRPLS